MLVNRGAAAALTLAVALVAIIAWRATRSGDANALVQEPVWEPLPRVVTVEVQNGGDIPGAARDAALRLRRARLPHGQRTRGAPVARSFATGAAR